MERQPNTVYVAALSYGKDSIAMLEAIHQLGYPLDAIVHSEVWATDTISADLPPMVEFKKKADKIIKQRYGIDVEHICAMRNGEKLTYEKLFYHKPVRKNAERERERESNGLEQTGTRLRSNIKPKRSADEEYKPYKGFPLRRGPWCNNLKDSEAIGKWCKKFCETAKPGGVINVVKYLGIAADEPVRIERHSKKDDVILPLVDIGWVEEYCRQWCYANDLLSPTYNTSLRGGCWFCHNQRLDQLRILRKEYPDLWRLLLKWDLDSPVSFHSDGHTVHDIDKRLAAEETGLVPADNRFRWKMLDDTCEQE